MGPDRAQPTKLQVSSFRSEVRQRAVRELTIVEPVGSDLELTYGRKAAAVRQFKI